MIEVRINYRDLIDIKFSELTDFYIQHVLRSGGFDLSKEIIRFDDYKNQQVVYQQKTH